MYWSYRPSGRFVRVNKNVTWPTSTEPRGGKNYGTFGCDRLILDPSYRPRIGPGIVAAIHCLSCTVLVTKTWMVGKNRQRRRKNDSKSTERADTIAVRLNRQK